MQQSAVRSTTKLEKLNNEIQELLNKKLELLTDKLEVFDFNILRDKSVLNIRKLSMDNQQRLLKQIIKKVYAFNDHATIEFPFAINHLGKTIASIQY